MVKCIIPAAGYGTRMNTKLNESKEMLPDIKNNNKPLIAYTLDLCKKYNMEPIVITRELKKDLILYLKNKTELILLDESKREWSESVLNSIKSWGDDNILLLPDTRFEPVEALEQAVMSLKQGSEFVFGSHKVDDLSKFGMIEYQKDTKELLVCEKPNIATPGNAWGFIGFKNNAKSINLFNVYSERNKFLYLKNFDIIYLDSFKDVTRTGKIE